jgi:hypothetical protein
MSNEIMYEMVNGERVEVSDVNRAEFIAAQENAQTTSNHYAIKRAAEYPPIGDQLDALWKGGAEAEAMLAKVQAVKDKYPKTVA